MVTFEQRWKHNSWDEEILQRLPPACRNAQPPQVTIPVAKVGHVTHYEDAEKIIRDEPGSNVGFTFNEKRGKNETYKEIAQYSFEKILPQAAVMSGAYSWWSICLPSDFQPPQLLNAPPHLYPIVSPCFASSYASVYGTIAMMVDFDVLLQSYRQLFEPNAEILYKCGGTLLYRKEVCRVIIVCCKERGIDPLSSIRDYNFNGDITFTRPFQGVKYIPKGEGGPGSKYYMSASSWDTFVFAFYQPMSNQMLSLSVRSQEISLAQVRHFVFNENGSRVLQTNEPFTSCHKNTEVAGIRTQCPDLRYKPPFAKLLQLLQDKQSH